MRKARRARLEHAIRTNLAANGASAAVHVTFSPYEEADSDTLAAFVVEAGPEGGLSLMEAYIDIDDEPHVSSDLWVPRECLPDLARVLADVLVPKGAERAGARPRVGGPGAGAGKNNGNGSNSKGRKG